MLTIRSERPEDFAGIRDVNVEAFGRPNEAALVEAIRGSSGFVPELSLVAVADGEVVGHILLSRIVIEAADRDIEALALAPVAVRPERQRQGIGSQLVRRSLELARGLGHRTVIVVGHPSYYPRFGFSPARARGLEAPFPVSDEAFMAAELAPGALDGVRGMVRYPAAFEAV